MVVAAACIPLPGHACWAGRLLLPAAVRDRWLRQRSDSPATESFEHGCLAAVGGADRYHQNDEEEEEEDAAVLEPVFRVQAVSRTVSGPDSEYRAIHIEVEANGTFVAQIPPGSYDLEVASEDDLLVGGLDGLQAVDGEARGEVEMTLIEAVSVSGTLVDEQGVKVEGELWFQRPNQAVTRSHDVPVGGGPFTVGGLRPGTYTVVTRIGGAASPPVYINAPATGIELRAPSLYVGMLLVGRQSDGECPPPTVVLMESMAPGDGGHTRRVPFADCRALAWNVRAVSRWTVTGQVGEYTIKQAITFGFGPTLPPVCLTGWCETDAAAVDTRVLAVTGGRDWLPVHLLEGPVDGPAKGEVVGLFTEGLRAGFSYTFAVNSEVSYSPRTVTLVPGVNTIIFRPR